MNVEQLRITISIADELPKCKHGHNLVDWECNILEPPCGCRIVLDPLPKDWYQRHKENDDEHEHV